MDIIFEKNYTEKIVVNNDNIKDPEVIGAVLRQKCGLIAKKSKNRPWVYFKEPVSFRTVGGIRLNKNSIGTVYIDTKLGYPLNAELIGAVSKESADWVSNKIQISDAKGFEKICDLINQLIKEEKIYLKDEKLD